MLVDNTYETVTGKEGVVTRVFSYGSIWVDVAGREFSYEPRSLSHADYKPETGDVVELEDGEKGILYHYHPDKLHIMVLMPSGGSYGRVPPNASRMKKIGHVDFVPDEVTCCANLDKDAKAYFSKSFTPTGSYEERQAQAVAHYGWKRGSKVRFTRSISVQEDGFGYGSLSSNIGDVLTISAIVTGMKSCIRMTDTEYAYPYFALEPATD